MGRTARSLRAFEELTGAGRVARYRRVALEALVAYDLDVARLFPVREGECMIFRVETQLGQRFALRIHNPGYQTEASVRSELHWLCSLSHDAGLAVPEPMQNRDGDLVTTAGARGIEGVRTCDVLSWQEGRFSYARTSAAAYRNIGANGD